MSFNWVCKDSGIKLRKFRQESTLLALSTFKHSILYDILHDVLEKTIPAGIPQYLEKYSIDVLFSKYEPYVDEEPKVLTLNDLGFGFVVWLVACGISMIGYAAEKLTFQLRKPMRTLIGLILFLKLFTWYLKRNTL